MVEVDMKKAERLTLAMQKALTDESNELIAEGEAASMIDVQVSILWLLNHEAARNQVNTKEGRKYLDGFAEKEEEGIDNG